MPKKDPRVAVSFKLATGAILIAAAIVGLTSGMVFSFDGAYAFYRLLVEGRIYVPMDRYGVILPALPGWLAFLLTGDQAVTRVAYSLGYVAMPVVSLALSYWFLPLERKAMLIWPAFGLAFGTAITQTFYTHEGLIACLLGWPVLLWLLGGARGVVQATAVALLVGVIYTLHPGSSVILAALSAAAYLGTRRVMVAGGFLALAIAKLTSIGYPYDRAELSWSLFWDYTSKDWGRAPLLALGFGLLIAIGHLWGLQNGGGKPRVLAGVGWFGAVVCFMVWVAHPLNRAYAIDFRQAVFFSSVIGYGFALVDAWLHEQSPSRRVVPSGTILALVALHFGVIAAWGVQFNAERTAVFDEIARAPGRCLARENVASLAGGTLAHWSHTYFVLIHSPRRPCKILATRQLCEAWAADRKVRLPLDDPRDHHGWFDLSCILAETASRHR